MGREGSKIRRRNVECEKRESWKSDAETLCSLTTTVFQSQRQLAGFQDIFFSGAVVAYYLCVMNLFWYDIYT